MRKITWRRQVAVYILKLWALAQELYAMGVSFQGGGESEFSPLGSPSARVSRAGEIYMGKISRA
ncbi:MAG: hypothetical protein A3F10_06395 [Coxiella sp. RIFCSPHIGHO2_12_FULL_42_15]|nr:MAG: hypothetical protein A3F10_06395 [Coxiella sp. RIFCSPHIGHO2_12_FULL_42_15]